MNPTIGIAKAAAVMIGAALFNITAAVIELAGQNNTTIELIKTIGICFCSVCSLLAVLFAHHVKVIVNSRMTEMVRLAGEAGELKEKKAQGIRNGKNIDKNQPKDQS